MCRDCRHSGRAETNNHDRHIGASALSYLLLVGGHRLSALECGVVKM